MCDAPSEAACTTPKARRIDKGTSTVSTLHLNNLRKSALEVRDQTILALLDSIVGCPVDVMRARFLTIHQQALRALAELNALQSSGTIPPLGEEDLAGLTRESLQEEFSRGRRASVAAEV